MNEASVFEYFRSKKADAQIEIGTTTDEFARHVDPVAWAEEILAGAELEPITIDPTREETMEESGNGGFRFHLPVVHNESIPRLIGLRASTHRAETLRMLVRLGLSSYDFRARFAALARRGVSGGNAATARGDQARR